MGGRFRPCNRAQTTGIGWRGGSLPANPGRCHLAFAACGEQSARFRKRIVPKISLYLPATHMVCVAMDSRAHVFVDGRQAGKRRVCDGPQF
jgi:hypothetical protein